jgi:hypothetical protein
MSNERLKSQIVAAGLTIGDIATEVAVDPKTVERWITQDRVPYRKHRWATAKLLSADEGYLWPSVIDDEHTATASQAEFVRLYTHRGMVPTELWTSLVNDAVEAIDVLVYAGLFLFDTNPEFADALSDRARQGCVVRLLLGDSDSAVVANRGAEEGIGADLAARIRLTLRALGGLADVPGVEIRQHATVLYNSIYRFDSQVLVNVHVYGGPAAHNPVIQLRRVPGGRMFDHFMRAFDQVWDLAVPVGGAG